MVVLKLAFDNVYPGGAKAFLQKFKTGEITDEFVIRETMWQSDFHKFKNTFNKLLNGA
jgi:hypothetical protein